MKRKLIIATLFFLGWANVSAQGEFDAIRASQTDLRGTARSMSMGGAFGALGGDVSAIAINPAGIGVYKSSEVVTTLDFQNVQTKTNLNAGELKDNKFKVGFNNLAFVATFPIHNDAAPLLNFGFSYNKVKSFDRKYQMRGTNLNNSMTGHMANTTDQLGLNSGDLGLGGTGDDYIYNRWKFRDDWFSVLGYNAFLIDQTGAGNTFQSNLRGNFDNALFVQEKGSINTYDFNFGTTFADMLSVGLTASITDVDYRLHSAYGEEFINTGDWYELQNALKTSGTGWKLGLGAIFKPIHELRIGVAYQSPTWYDMTDSYWADLHHDLATGTAIDPKYKSGVVESGGGYWTDTKYELRTPDKWTFSLAGILGKNAIISLDYELVDYSKMNLKDDNGAKMVGRNSEIKEDFRLASTIRVGGEYRITPQLSARVGYQWQQSPYENKFRDAIEVVPYTVTSVPHYVVDGNTNYYTWGIGYKFTKNIYSDIAFVYKTQKADLYSFSDSDKAELKSNTFQGALTVGFRF